MDYPINPSQDFMSTTNAYSGAFETLTHISDVTPTHSEIDQFLAELPPPRINATDSQNKFSTTLSVTLTTIPAKAVRVVADAFERVVSTVNGDVK